MMKMPNFRSQLYVIRHMLTIALLAQTMRFLLVKHTINWESYLLKKGGFRFRKWANNVIALLFDLDPADHGLAIHKILQDEYL